ncbi:MAG TPA: hypothetical protein DC049_03320 [Spirochaetia bacterium]|nr:hypothetical protein [Spirochaetia bacterium]
MQMTCKTAAVFLLFFSFCISANDANGYFYKVEKMSSENGVLFSQHELFVQHPLGIHGNLEPWREDCSGDIYGKLGNEATYYKFSNIQNEKIILDIPTSPRRLRYNPFPFKALFIKVKSEKAAKVKFYFIASNDEEEIKYSKPGSLTYSEEVTIDANWKMFKLDIDVINNERKNSGKEKIPGVNQVIIKNMDSDTMYVELPYLDVSYEAAMRLRYKRFLNWYDYMLLDQEIFAIHTIGAAKAESYAKKIKSIFDKTTDEFDIETDTKDKFNIELKSIKINEQLENRIKELTGLFNGYLYSTECIYRLIGIREELDLLEKRIALLKDNDVISQKELQIFNQLKKDFDILNTENLAEILTFKKNTDIIENQIWEKWSTSKYGTYRSGLDIFTAEQEHMSLMGINDFEIATDRMFAEEDYMYMKTLGYRLIRMPIRDKAWDDSVGFYSSDYLEKYNTAARWAARYGLNVISEIHYLPDTIMAEYRNTGENQSFYDAIECGDWIETQIVKLLSAIKPNPSIAIFEVPQNEPYLHGNSSRKNNHTLPDHTIIGNKTLMKKWNVYLKNKYTSPAALHNVWSQGVLYNNENGLQKNENWENSSILPPGLINVPMAYNARLYDYIQWFEYEHNSLCDRLAVKIKSIKPHMLISQAVPCQSGSASYDPVHLDGFYLMQNVTSNIDLITSHYNLGTYQRLTSLDIPGYMGEEFGQNEKRWNVMHDRNGGNLPWAWGTRYRKGEDLIELDENGYPWFDKRYLIINQKKLNTPSQKYKAQIIILPAKRLVCRGDLKWLAVADMLDSMNITYKIIDQDVIINKPYLLQECKAIIFENNYGDPDVIRYLVASKKPVLFTGELCFDKYAHFGKDGILKGFYDNKIFIKKVPDITINDFRLNLDEKWELGIVGGTQNNKSEKEGLMYSRLSGFKPDKSVNFTEEITSIKDWSEIVVPGFLQHYREKMNMQFKRVYYKTTIDLPEIDNGMVMYSLQIGGVYDYDWIYINNSLIGNTLIVNNQSWHQHRLYIIPQNYMHKKKNTVYIRIQDGSAIGGIWDGPVAFLKCYTGIPLIKKNNIGIDINSVLSQYSCVYAPNLSEVLRENALTIGTIGTFPFLIQDGKYLLHLGGEEFSIRNSGHVDLINALLIMEKK